MRASDPGLDLKLLVAENTTAFSGRFKYSLFRILPQLCVGGEGETLAPLELSRIGTTTG
jgi:hypothetical protein